MAAFEGMVKAVRNAGHAGAVGYAISAVDIALWDLKARLLELPLHRLLGAVHDEAPAWSVVMRAALAAFYSHPWAWNEIGFGGPAYPRGFMRLGGSGTDGPGVREPFERLGATDENPVHLMQGWEP